MCVEVQPGLAWRIQMHLCLTVECITSGLHFSVFQLGLTPPLLSMHRHTCTRCAPFCSWSCTPHTYPSPQRTLRRGRDNGSITQPLSSTARRAAIFEVFAPNPNPTSSVVRILQFHCFGKGSPPVRRGTSVPLLAHQQRRAHTNKVSGR